MPVTTNLDQSPYFDDFDPTKGFAKVLFQPGVSVQVRELNQLQSILQSQVEKFGDNIFRSGTIISGCNFSFLDYYPYCKISDQSVNGISTIPTTYPGLFAKNANNLVAYITDSVDGFETRAPDLKTLYLSYINSGDSMTATSFTAGDTLTIYSGNNSLFAIQVVSGGIGFSNTDQVIISGAVSVNTSSGSFSNGDYLVNPTTGANVQIVGITTATNGSQILSIKPRLADLTNPTSNSTAWTFSQFDVVRNSSNTVTGSVDNVYGQGAKASIITNATGKITDTILTVQGAGYTVVPQVWVRSSNNNTGLASLNLLAQNYLTNVTIPATSNSVGNAYAFGVSDGVIYQKGYFIDVKAQRILVSKYSSSPNNVSVGFTTAESIITSNIDSSLLDNALGTQNQTAPGADRLMLTPTLVVGNTDVIRANSEFLTLVEWNSGFPYKQSQSTQYSVIEKEMAARTSEASGNFVLDPFQVATDSVSNASLESTFYTAVVDPGTAYINGYRTQTLSNYRIDVRKGTDTKINKGQKISLNYGNYIRINQVAGLFQFSTGDLISLYDTPATFLANNTNLNSGIITPVGNQIGTARIRNMTLESGIAGDPTAVYRLYLFSVRPLAGMNIKNTKSIYYGGTFKGIADTVLTFDPTTGINITAINQTLSSGLVFQSGLESIKNSNNTTYIYRNIDQTLSTANTGRLVKSLAANPNDFFPYSGSLSSSQMLDLYVVPVSNNLVAFNSLGGNVTINTTSTALVGNGTTFLSDLQAGDYITIINAGVGNLKKIISVSNNIFATLDSVGAVANSGLSYFRAFPKNVPVPFGTRTGLSANVDANSNILTLNYGMTFSGTTSVNTALGYNASTIGAISTPKTANRLQMVKIAVGNSVGGTQGPWCIGVPDAFRLRNVFIGNSSVDTTGINITDQFYIDNNHNVDYADLSYLYLNQKHSISLANTDYLLLQFAYYTTAGAGYFDTVSYLRTANAAQIAALDSTPLANLTSSACSWEVPEMYSAGGNYFDFLNCFDFRPSVVATVTPTTSANTAPINPAYILSFGNTADPSNSKKFPAPDALFTTDVEYYLGRTDSIVIPSNTNITVYTGNPSPNLSKRLEPNIPPKSLKLQSISVPAYPNLTTTISLATKALIDTKTYNSKNLNERLQKHVILPTFDANTVALNQPVAPTADKVSHLERRINTLEYYQALTLLETSITNKIIPSSINGSINRFKYGFFVDDFSTKLYSDVNNPQYFASIETANVSTTNILTSNSIPQLASNVLVPGKFTFGLKHVISDLDIIYTDYKIVDQTNATVPKPLCNLSPIISSTSSVVSTSTTPGYFFKTARGGRSSGIRNATLSRTTGGRCKFYWAVYYDPFFYVKKNGVTIASSVSARPITAAEKAFILSDQYTQPFFESATSLGGAIADWDLFKRFSISSGGWVNGGGVFEFDHDPTTGSDYTLGVIDNAYPGTNFIEYLMIGPVDNSVGSGLVSDPCGTAISSIYNGTMSVNTSLFSASSSSHIPIACTGLKPLSTHYFFINGTNITSLVRQFGKNLGDPLVTDSTGYIRFEYYYNAGSIVSSTASVPYIQIASAADLSFDHEFTIVGKSSGTLNIELKTVGSGCSYKLSIT